MIYGLDVSSYQPEEFPLTTPDGKPVDFVIIKATQGLGYTNPKLQGQLDWARKNGLSVGFYHFGDAGSVDKQAEFFLASVRPRLRLGDHLWFDWEKEDITCADKDEWIRRVMDAQPEHKVGLYCNRDFWLNHDTTSFDGDALWIADWTGAGTPPRIEAPWRIHQYETTRSIDENVADFESRAAMKAWAGEPVPPGGDNADVLAALVQVVESLALGFNAVQRTLATIQEDLEARADDTAAVRAAQVQLAKRVTELPKKVADEINKRLAE